MATLLNNRAFVIFLIAAFFVAIGWLFFKAGFYGKQYNYQGNYSFTYSTITPSPTPTPTPDPTFALQINQLSDLEKKTSEMLNESVVGEQIKDFTVNIDIKKDGSMTIREDILYHFPSPRHGIYRNIPFTIHDGDTRYDMNYTFSDVVDDKGKKYKVEKGKSGEQWVLKIGDPDKTIEGDNRYVIFYKVEGGLRYFEDHDELYWNITGNSWEVPIRKATAIINLPQEVSESEIKIECYSGAHGDNAKNCTGISNGKSTIFSTSIFLNSYQGLTVVKGFPKGIVDVLMPERFIPFHERWYGKLTIAGLIIASTLWYIVLPIYLLVKWLRFGRDPNVGIPVTSAYDIPKIGTRELTPAELGALVDEHVDKRDLFATIVDLARRGHIKIREPKDKEFHLDKTKPKKKDIIQSFEKSLLDGIFSGVETVELKKVKFYTTASKVETELYKLMVDHKFFPKNPRTTRNLYYALGSVSLITANFVLAFIAFLFGRHMPAKTIHGAQVAVKARGLRNFLKSQERQLNFQGDKQMFFEKLLPFAAAFGVEKAWAKRFEHIDLKSPDWYEGTSGHAFRSAVFASHLSNSYSSFASSSTPPSSSGSGFSGGSSGGGGGGGGGGSW